MALIFEDALMTPEIHQVFIDIKLPKGNDPGQVAYGYYTLVDGVVTMTNQKGEPAQDDTGKTYTAKLLPNDDANVIAGRLTRKLRDALLGKKDGAPPSGFSGPLNYGPTDIY
jgi:hypothetical protein